MLEIKAAAYPSYEQWDLVINGMRNPMNSWDKGDSTLYYVMKEDGLKKLSESEELEEIDEALLFEPVRMFMMGDKDKDLAKRLISSGSEHRKFLQQLPIIVDIKAPLYFWKQFDTYRLGVTKNSCSTMHKLTEREFTREDFSHEERNLYPDTEKYRPLGEDPLDAIIKELNSVRHMYLIIRDVDQNYDRAKDYWNEINELLPQSYNQLRTVSLNYETLFNICKQRAGHKLDEWRVFINWALERVPYFQFLCFDKLCEESEAFNRIYGGGLINE